MVESAPDPQPQLNRLHAQVKQLRSLTTILGALVIALVAVTIWSLVRKQSTIVLEHGDHRLELSADSIRLKDSRGNVSLTPTDMQMHPKKAPENYLALSVGAYPAVSLRSDGGNARLEAGPDAGLHLLSNNTLGDFVVSDSKAHLSLSSPGDHFINVETGAKGALIYGSTSTRFQLGDDPRVSGSPPPPAPAEPAK